METASRDGGRPAEQADTSLSGGENYGQLIQRQESRKKTNVSQLVAFSSFCRRELWSETLYAVETIISQVRPNQPQRGSLSVSRTGKEGSGDSR